jgi:hypothetical protein
MHPAITSFLDEVRLAGRAKGLLSRQRRINQFILQ